MNAKRQGDFTEAFEVIGSKAAVVDKHTFGIILRSLGLNPTDDELSGLFTSVADGGSVNIDGLLKAATEFEAKMKGKDTGSELKEAFAVFDKEKTGKVSAAELRHVIANLGEKVDDDEIEDMMKEADTDGSGTIDYNEFVSVLMRATDVPPRVEIPEELKPYMEGKKKEKAAAAEQSA
mmetsp:Transcript_32215/g.84475  ORF Transcript_32215/g.84475 Transcript_32215/m.84475 type:complete len:178 (+) Transcript_32215:129-662(+)|eukprot:CAMPEP_0115851580 /NCGR_PEP_ID=MMETSP0287-20121206/12556_1 /TAXON_ID=412157 /ORGANISM="Chrysochromulina rotalis, Strain UIO044" /LENGTH=177 /DNA_ID=CAMNT_0003305619 /DNA_START=107 /DNA_END=640 /DNA_ORIENTATION=-